MRSNWITKELQLIIKPKFKLISKKKQANHQVKLVSVNVILLMLWIKNARKKKIKINYQVIDDTEDTYEQIL